MNLRRIAVLASFAASTAVCAQPPVCVSVSHGRQSSAGQRLHYFIKEGIRKSMTMRLDDNCTPRLELSLLTHEENGLLIYSVAWSARLNNDSIPYYLNHALGNVGVRNVQQSAENLVGEADKLIEIAGLARM